MVSPNKLTNEIGIVVRALPLEEISLISIVIPVFNQLVYTKECLIHLRQYTDVPFELIFVDNGSTDGTNNYLQTQDVHLISNSQNRGVYTAWNQGIQECKSDHIVIMNNDILVTPHWSSALLRFSQKESRRVVGPAMREGALDYSLIEYSNKLTTQCLLASRMDELCNFSLVMFHRAFFDEVGLFDEQFFVTRGDDDMILRLKQKNIGLAVTGSAFVHHYSEKTQEVHSIGFNIKEIRKNDDWLFQKKWGDLPRPQGMRKVLHKLKNHFTPAYEKIRFGFPLKIPKPKQERLINQSR